MPIDNRKLVTIPDFVLKYEKDAIFFFMKNMMEKLWNPAVYTKNNKFLFFIFLMHFSCFFFKFGSGLTQPNGPAKVGQRPTIARLAREQPGQEKKRKMQNT